MPIKIITIIGARPQFVKATFVSRDINLHNQNVAVKEQITEKIIHTGQHYDSNMSDIFFAEMDIPKPDIVLGNHQLSHGAMTGRIIAEFLYPRIPTE